MAGRGIEDLGDDDTVVDLVVGPRLRPLEGFTVNRVWPVPRRRLIGPFVFFDHMQPARLPAGTGFDVPPHPHIGRDLGLAQEPDEGTVRLDRFPDRAEAIGAGGAVNCANCGVDDDDVNRWRCLDCPRSS